MRDYLVVRSQTYMLVVGADSPQDALAKTKSVSTGDFALHDTVDTIDPGYGVFPQLMREKP